MGLKTIIGGAVVVVCAGFVLTHQASTIATAQHVYESAVDKLSGHVAFAQSEPTSSDHAKVHVKPVIKPTTNNAPKPDPVVIDGVYLRYNPYKSSDGAYPVLKPNERVWIDVSIDQELVYIFQGDHLLYTMITSSGIDKAPDSSTPLGVYHIQSERGTWFYADQYQMGAKYWVSWHGHGIFLFHSVPMNKDEQVLLHVAAKLGHPASEGCFHLTIPDAKWFYGHIPYRTEVVVEQAPLQLLGHTLYDPSSVQRLAEQATAPQDAQTTGMTN
ncbi:L,D-transpeptidase [Sulfoacidibacillus ferrooxidans]|uniref:L,D-TPase catalytic domain-containing protein n=1 Tax=Sulfoacidibacillus ferrooxidans TaxID=2005001 RepID=A0A9X1V757_9BACL|nr:L,D-transpeptidase [Sulfoacidibacillus ferrooxidans]MCI0182254.1 hypothetical protein [Sulfoacidibacillus ferrooxidans]